MKNNKEIIDFIKECTCSYTTVNYITSILEKNNYIYLKPGTIWNIKPNNNYYTTINDSSIIAFKIPSKYKSFNIIVSHSDTPSLKLKPNGIYNTNNITLYNLMPYGGLINYSFLDHPLSIAGKIAIKEKNTIKTKIIDLKTPKLIIPSVAIHLQTEANNNLNVNSEDHLQAILDINNKNITLNKILNEKNLLDYDLYAYSSIEPTTIGSKQDILLSPRIDNLTSIYASLKAFLETNTNNITIFATFNHEEIGSITKEGADSTFLSDILHIICSSLKLDYYSTLKKSIIMSSDNTHAMHPNYNEYDSKTTNISLGKGLAIIYDKSSTTDILLTSKLKDKLDSKRILYQDYSGRNDIAGGGTISSIIIKHISIPCIEIGIGELSMHSSLETCSLKDINYLYKAMIEFYLLT